MDIEKVKWMFALRASDSGIVELLLLILNIPRVEQEFPSLSSNQNTSSSAAAEASPHSPEALLRFLGKICCNERRRTREPIVHGSSFDGESFCRR
ncbi:uncharacterized protein G2W53_007834 [Senna tora]|uniref:Uncharacterized protein n=1 Tax=Senna tora TaxID=362788 RepID=A0A834X7Q4_9FABA|nr:uncharacterized protein G2W53_007834 [Senna tora]